MKGEVVDRIVSLSHLPDGCRESQGLFGQSAREHSRMELIAVG